MLVYSMLLQNKFAQRSIACGCEHGGDVKAMQVTILVVFQTGGTMKTR